MAVVQTPVVIVPYLYLHRGTASPNFRVAILLLVVRARVLALV